VIARLWHGVVPAIRAFAGDDIERARYYPEDRTFLLEMEPRVTHYEVLGAPIAGTREDA